jgi:hypothetical protein
MKALITIAIAAAVATLSACAGAPSRGDYRDQDQVRYEHRDHYYHHGEDGRWNDGDHAGGTGTPD